MKILFFIEHLGLGGVVRQVSILADQLRRRGHDVSLLALYELDQDWNLVAKANFAVLTQKPKSLVSGGIRFTKAALALRRVLRKTNVDIVYTLQGQNARLIAWLATRGIGKTQLVWGVRGAGRKGTSVSRNWKQAFQYRLGKWISRSVPLMIANSETGLLRRNSGGYRCGKHLVITNGFDTNKFKPDSKARVRLRSEWKIGNEALIGIVGRLVFGKGHRTFLEAAAILRGERADVRFVIVGDGPDQRKIEFLSQELGLTESLILLGPRQDMPAVYNALDIFCSASYSEGLPNVIGEAMACGVPCVVTDVGDCAKVVGHEGIVVPPGDSQLLASGLKTMLLKLDEIKVLEIRDRIVKHFDLDTMVDATEKALSEIGCPTSDQ